MTNIPSKKCNYGESATIRNKLLYALSALEVISESNGNSIKEDGRLYSLKSYAGTAIKEITGEIQFEPNSDVKRIAEEHFSETVKKVELLKKIDELEKKLDIAMSVLKRYEITDEFEGGVGSEYEDMMWDCTEELKRIADVSKTIKEA